MRFGGCNEKAMCQELWIYSINQPAGSHVLVFTEAHRKRISHLDEKWDEYLLLKRTPEAPALRSMQKIGGEKMYHIAAHPCTRTAVGEQITSVSAALFEVSCVYRISKLKCHQPTSAKTVFINAIHPLNSCSHNREARGHLIGSRKGHSPYESVTPQVHLAPEQKTHNESGWLRQYSQQGTMSSLWDIRGWKTAPASLIVSGMELEDGVYCNNPCGV